MLECVLIFTQLVLENNLSFVTTQHLFELINQCLKSCENTAAEDTIYRYGFE